MRNEVLAHFVFHRVAIMIQQYVDGMNSCGSNHLEEEEATIFQWEWWIMAIEEKEVDHTLEEVLVFITGADCLPPLGFPQSCRIDFYDQEPGSWRLPYA
ncbi:hypothetical protein AMECASPLE_024446 [Ameca splendens]|uniref:Uncharacterized protein n=1 Tax=Ameca splendens TaxID=208324 RepID=A0ABV0XTA9_9TELE